MLLLELYWGGIGALILGSDHKEIDLSDSKVGNNDVEEVQPVPFVPLEPRDTVELVPEQAQDPIYPGYSCDNNYVNRDFARAWKGSQSRYRSIETGKETGRHDKYALYMDGFYEAFDKLVEESSPNTIGELLGLVEQAYVETNKQNLAAISAFGGSTSLVISHEQYRDDGVRIELNSADAGQQSLLENENIEGLFEPKDFAGQPRFGGLDIEIYFFAPGKNYILERVTEGLGRNTELSLESPIADALGRTRYVHDPKALTGVLEPKDLRALGCDNFNPRPGG